jgi:hypothetical protein
MIKTITHHAPQFLKDTWKHHQVSLVLVPTIDHVLAGELFIEWQGKAYGLYRLTQDRAPRFIGLYRDIMGALFKAEQLD